MCARSHEALPLHHATTIWFIRAVVMDVHKRAAFIIDGKTVSGCQATTNGKTAAFLMKGLTLMWDMFG